MSALQKVFGYWFLVIGFLFVANLFIFTPPTLAATTPDPSFQKLDSNNYDDSISVQRYYRNQLVTLYTIFLGTDPTGGPIYGEKLGYVTENGQTKLTAVPGLTTGSVNNGALGMLSSGIMALYNPPTSSIEYLANLGENIGLSPKVAHAQVTGSGADVISPVLALWQVVRNIAYAGFILVFITAGLMIMFRQKLNPQTIIGIQQALPGLIIGLILVTFSYFIAAFIVDLTFVGTRLVTEIFISTNQDNYFGCTVDCDQTKRQKQTLSTYETSSAFDMYGRASTRIQNLNDFAGQIWQVLSPKLPDSDKNKAWYERIYEGITQATIFTVQGAIAGITATLGSLFVSIILIIALMIQFIRLLIALLMSYIQILIMVIGGPIFILVSAIPGKGGVLSYWFKGLLANALVFPAVFAGFLFAGMILSYNFQSNTAHMPLFGGLDTGIIKSLLAFGILLGLPSIPDMVRGAFGVKGPEGFSKAAIGGFMGGLNTGRSTATGGYNQAMEKTGIRFWQQAKQKAEIEDKASMYTPGSQPTVLGGNSLWSRVKRGLINRGP